MVSLETETDRTLFFDLLPIDVGVIGGMKVRLQLYTVPGQVFYNNTRKLVLKGVDGVVFVADSQSAALQSNIDSLGNLKANLAEMNLGFDSVPLVFQFNKRDIRNILPVEDLNRALNPQGFPFFEAAALHGIGVFETLKAISKLAIASVRKKLGDQDPFRRSPTTRPVAITPALAQPAPASDIASLVTETPQAAAAPPPPAPRPVPVEAAAPAVVVAPAAPVAAAGEDAIDFAEAESRNGVKRIPTQATPDISKELAKLRTLTGKDAGKAKEKAKPHVIEPSKVFEQQLRGLQSALGESTSSKEVRRKGVLEVPGKTLGGATAIRVHVVVDTANGERVFKDALTLKLSDTKKLEKLALHLDLELREP
jgi:signal recognition particle receptor subunit beta